MGFKVTLEKFIDRSNIIHSNKYDYSNSVYINNKIPIVIICKEHGEFEQLPSNHLNGSGCKDCFFYKKRNDVEYFINLSKKIHKGKYLYNLVKYKSNVDNVIILCKEHGEFKQQPKHHLNGHGCPSCGGTKKLTKEKFIEKSKKIHYDKYNYSLVEYKDNQTKVKIICKEHNIFEQRPDDHMRGRGCKRCSDKFGILENIWLDDNNIKNRQVRIGRYIVDGYDTETNTIYEFNGDYWHGNPYKYKKDDINPSCKKSFGELYRKTIDKERTLLNKGYNIISIWESEYINKNKNTICH